MLIVGAQQFEAFWARHPAAEAQLRALYALLTRAQGEDVQRLLAGGEPGPGGRVKLTLQTAVVGLRLGPNGTAIVETVEARP